MSAWPFLFRVLLQSARETFPARWAIAGAGLVVVARAAGWAWLEPWGLVLLVPVAGWVVFFAFVFAFVPGWTGWVILRRKRRPR